VERCKGIRSEEDQNGGKAHRQVIGGEKKGIHGGSRAIGERAGKIAMKCKECHRAISLHDDAPPIDFDDGAQRVEGGYMCHDCYFEAMGDEIEKHPIGK
jgi:hypothetical protein